MKPFGWALMGAGAAVLAMAWCGRGDRAELAAALARQHALEARTDSLDRAHAADSADIADSLRKLNITLVALDEAQENALARATARAAHLVALPDTLVPKRLALAAVAAKDSAIHLLAARVFTLIADTVQLHQRWLGAAREAVAWRQIALDAQTELAQANKRSRPRWGCTGGVTAGGGVGVTAGAGHLAAGPSVLAGLGITCGRNL